MNALARETSPYLRQHKDNPVDWHVWSEDTFARAAELDKPVLLSIGYSACHWCHVMAAESFENPGIAALLNDLFIAVKVDREERPDIDAVYQNALALLGQHGGWPLTMFLTPAGEPFWGGTYYPPVNRYGRMAFPDVLRRAADVYHNNKQAVTKNTGALLRGLSLPSSAGVLTSALLDAAAAKLAALVDPVEGGLGQAPKFPQAPLFGFLWRGWRRTGDRRPRDGVLLTLERMAQGGIYDHLGGGFCRYSTDASWLVPHFEKMLYDNAQLVELMCWAFQETRQPLFAQRIAETVEWMLREMRVSGGGFAAALDADSEHEEGRFYVWTAAEIETLLGGEAKLFKAHYDVHRIGNWEGRSILNRSAYPEFADEAIEQRLAAARRILLAARETRVRPRRDHKVLADWNGLAIAALCLAASVFDKPQWLEAAKTAFDFVRHNLTAPDGRLLHSWCDGRTHPGLLDDYAAMSRAALALAQATGEETYLAAARQWIALADRHFLDVTQGGYFLTADDARDLIVRLRGAGDHATPSGNALMLEVLAALHYMTGETHYLDKAERLAGAFIGEAENNPVGLAGLLSAAELLLHAVQIVLFPGVGMADMLHVLHNCPQPNRVLIHAGGARPAHHPAASRRSIGGLATVYVCHGQSCSLPLTDPQALRDMLSTPGHQDTQA